MVVNARGTTEVAATYVSRGSTTETLSFSIFQIHRSPETKLSFLHGARSKQIHGSSMGPEGTANVGRPFSAEYLEHTIYFDNERWSKKTTNVSSCLLRSVFLEERLRIHVRRGMPISRDTYPNLAEYYPSMPCHLKERAFSQISVANHGESRQPSITTLTLPTRS